MIKHTFNKMNETWYVQHAGNNNRRLEMNEGAASLLNLLSGTDPNVRITFHNEYFDDADNLWLLQSTQPFLDGGYYYMDKCNGREINYHIWLCDLLKLVFGTTPQQIFVRKEWSWP